MILYYVILYNFNKLSILYNLYFVFFLKYRFDIKNKFYKNIYFNNNIIYTVKNN